MAHFRTRLSGFRHFSIWTFASSVLHAFGVLWLLIEPGVSLWPGFADFVRAWWWIVPGVGAGIGLWRAWPRLWVRSQICGTDAVIELLVGDVLEQDGVLVLGSNTTFDTSIEDGTISEKSVQGQYTTTYCDELANLDRQIQDSLKDVDYEARDRATKPYGKLAEYEIGTVSSAVCKGKRAYFVAIASLNANRVASATKDEILDALPRIWEFIRTKGGVDPIAMPILGSGLARVAATREELTREIIKSFIAAAQVGRFCEHLSIVVSSKDFRNGHIDLLALGRFMEHECTYTFGPSPPPSTAHGIPADP